jgi:hypothetical protein
MAAASRNSVGLDSGAALRIYFGFEFESPDFDLTQSLLIGWACRVRGFGKGTPKN